MSISLWLAVLVSVALLFLFGKPILSLLTGPRPRGIDDLSSRRPNRVTGRVCAAEKTLIAPLSGRACVAWTLEIQRADDLTDHTLSTRWETIEVESEKTDFLVEDETGRAVVHMEVVEIDMATKSSGMTSLLGALPEERRQWLEARTHHELADDALGFRLVERLLAEGERVEIVGIRDGSKNGLPVIAHPEGDALRVKSLPGYGEEKSPADTK